MIPSKRLHNNCVVLSRRGEPTQISAAVQASQTTKLATKATTQEQEDAMSVPASEADAVRHKLIEPIAVPIQQQQQLPH
jgi:hypothetical protein